MSVSSIKKRSIEALVPLRPVECSVCGARPIEGWHAGDYKIECPNDHLVTPEDGVTSLSVVISVLSVPHSVRACSKALATKVWNRAHGCSKETEA